MANRNLKLINGRQRKINTGPKGGEYYMKGGSKVYLKHGRWR